MKALLIGGAACLVLALFFRFALVGYSFLSLCLLGLAAVLLLYALGLKKRLHWLCVGLTALLCLGFALFWIAEIPVIRASQGSPDQDAGALIVLGAGVNGRNPSLSMLDRLEAALTWLEAHPGALCVLSGGQGPGEELSEAEAMADWLTAKGIPAERLILEEKSTTTQENLRFSFELLEGRGMPSAETAIAIASSEYHLCRAEALARRLGAECAGVPGRTRLPVLRLNYFLREAAALWALWLGA